MRKAPDHRFPWRPGNRFRLLVDGGQFFPVMLEAIAGARNTIHLELYLVKSGVLVGRFVQALVVARQRGAEVRLLFDDFGARELKETDRQRLQRAGVQLFFYNPLRYGHWRRNLFRDHRKLLIVDGALAYVGGAGLTDEFAPLPDTLYPWHDLMLEIEGPIVGDWEQVFAQVWGRWSGQTLDPPQPPAELSDGGAGRVALSKGSESADIKRSLLKRLRGAERRVWLATGYFLPSRKIRRALRHAAHQGVDVRLLLPGPHTDHPAVRHAGRRFFGRLLRHGVRIYEYQPRFLHAKAVLCDNWVSIGSSNVDRWNLRWNLEANQEIDDQPMAEAVQAWFEGDFRLSEELDYRTWQRRRWWWRLLERLWGGIDRLVDRVLQR